MNSARAPQAKIRGYIADANGGVDWLTPFQGEEAGFHDFLAQIGALVMGRGTYEAIRAFDIGWPYPGKPGIVVTSRDDLDLFDGVTAWRDGLNTLIPHLRARAGGDVWVLGGGRLQGAFIAAGALDRLDLFLVPVLLGTGVPLFPGVLSPNPIEPRSTTLLGNGLIHLDLSLA